ncbi:phosphoribosyltransferase family protein [Roseateles sp. L2-2]|uniref:phosphoribosyltransferase family protein n=1 Tax=Roseateles sp. L2-2 TaxID=3422597 RepID=UPI003D36CAD0
MKPEIVPIPWKDVEAWLRELAQRMGGVDCILGIARSGAPLATALSYLTPNATLGYVTRTVPVGPEAASYDFEGSRKDRAADLARTLRLPTLPEGLRSFLIVDDVATFGDTMDRVRRLVASRYPEASIRMACFAADVERVRDAHPDLVALIEHSRGIDNQATYLTFPWNLESI